MNNENVQQKIRRKVFERLEYGEITMRPRVYFIARAALAVLVSLIVLILAAYVLSFIAFSVHESGEQFLLGYGAHGVYEFLSLFPWFTLIIEAALIIFLEWLLQSFKLGYRYSLLILFGAVTGVSLIMAALIGLTPLNSDLLELANRGGFPVIGDMYDHIRDSHEHQGIFRGTITAIQGNQMVIAHDDADDGTKIIILPPGYSTTTLRIGARVYTFGVPGSTTIQAYGADQLPPNE